MNYSDFRFTLDIQIHQAQVSVPVTFGDSARRLCIGLTDGRKPYVIGEGCRAVFNAKKPDGNVIKNDCIIERNVILYEFTEQTTNSEGIVYCDITIYDTDGKVLTSPQFTIVVDKRVVRDAELIATLSESESTALDRIFTSEKDRQDTFETNEATRSATFEANETERQADFNAAYAEIKAQYDALGVVQTPGDSETKVMSQKAVTDYVPKVATKNLMTLTFANGIVVESTGAFQSYTTGLGSTASPDYIELKDDERTYTFSWSSLLPQQTINFYQYDADKKVLGKISKTIWETPPRSISITFDDGCKYIRIHSQPFNGKIEWEKVVPIDFQMEVGSEATEYIPPFIISDSVAGVSGRANSVFNSRISQTSGDSETAVMSQKAVVNAISEVLTEGRNVAMKTAYTTEVAKDANESFVQMPLNLSTLIGWCLPIRKDKFPNKTVGISLRVISNTDTLNVALALYDKNQVLIKELTQETLSLNIWDSEKGIYAVEHTFSCNLTRNLITTDVVYIRVYIPNTTASTAERLQLGYIKPNQATALNETDINVKETPIYFNLVTNSSTWSVHHYNTDADGKPIPASFNIWLRLKQEDKNAFPYASYGLPVLELSGSTLGMNKDTNVTLLYKYGDRTGSCTLKWQGSSSIAYPKKNYTIKFDSKFEAKTGWGEQKKYCLKANYIDFTHARNLVSAKLWGDVVKSRTPSNETLNALVNAGAVDGFPICLTINGEYQGLYTFNIPKDGWMFGMGDEDATAKMAILCANAGDETGAKACSFKALATVTEDDLEIEYATDEDDTAWINTSVNRLIQACIDSDGTDLDTTIAQYLDWESAIDYYIFCLISKHFDGLTKNYLLVTYDGTKWFFSGYDMDSTFGLWFNGSKLINAYDNDVEQLAAQNRVFELIKKYKADELKERYRKLVLKQNGALSEENIVEAFNNFICKIPKAVLDEEVKIWTTLPSTSVNNVAQIIDFNRRRRAYIDPQIEKL